MRPFLLVLSLALALSGCARIAASPVNPLNWFGVSPAGQQVAGTAPAGPASLVPTGRAIAIVDLRVPVARITGVQTDSGPNGVLVTATGLTARPGAFNAALVETGRTGGTLTLQMQAELPPQARAGTQQITSGLMLQNGSLAGISTIVVTSAANSLSARR